MNPKPRARGKSAGWKPPRDRREVVTAVLASLTVIVITAALVWFLRPNRESTATPVINTVATSTTAPGATTTVPGATTTAPVTTAPPTAPSSTP
jgi:cytoskeletal protein RodZ